MQFAYNIAIIHESPKIFVKFCKILYFCTEISKKNIRFASVCKLHVTKNSSIPIIYRAKLVFFYHITTSLTKKQIQKHQ